MASKNIKKLGLYLNALIIARNAWIFQDRKLINGTDETLATATDNLYNPWGVLSGHFDDFNMGLSICMFSPAIL
jgi:hypothetical protein